MPSGERGSGSPSSLPTPAIGTGKSWASESLPPSHSGTESLQGPRLEPFFFLFQKVLHCLARVQNSANLLCRYGFTVCGGSDPLN
jgi:hypothetical protein